MDPHAADAPPAKRARHAGDDAAAAASAAAAAGSPAAAHVAPPLNPVDLTAPAVGEDLAVKGTDAEAHVAPLHAGDAAGDVAGEAAEDAEISLGTRADRADPAAQAAPAGQTESAKLLVENLARYSTTADVRKLLGKAGCGNVRVKKSPDWTYAYVVFDVRRRRGVTRRWRRTTQAHGWGHGANGATQTVAERDAALKTVPTLVVKGRNLRATVAEATERAGLQVRPPRALAPLPPLDLTS